MITESIIVNKHILGIYVTFVRNVNFFLIMKISSHIVKIILKSLKPLNQF
jgi:hypothetical protein